MHRSVDRILTTQAGSLQRPVALLDLIRARGDGQAVDEEQYANELRKAVQGVVDKQVEAGLDVVGDGEQSRATYKYYVLERLTGFEESSAVAESTGLLPAGSRLATSSQRKRREHELFPEFFRKYQQIPYYTEVVGAYPRQRKPLVCVGPVTYVGQEAVQTDIANLKAAIEGKSVQDAFLTATSISLRQRNEYYADTEEYLFAIADALHEEYTAIVNAGLLLQIDDPALFAGPYLNEDDAQREVSIRIEAQNYALRDIPEDRVRFHLCYGPAMAPKIDDPMLGEFIDRMLEIHAAAYSFEAANPRHYTDYHVFEDVKLPDGKILIPGVLMHGSNIVEHPEFVAELITNYARLVGRENVIASNDCGFSSSALYTPEVDEKVGWAKLQAMAEGAKIASDRLWNRG